ncbi:MAG: dihydroorotase [Bacteroidetes bacterium 24-39-8]|jgi:dihydroorotase|nr:MAG: dihydroorotase [Sphingobacteriia bacterium 35-40-8]OYZ47869.1 MAG: dihydroorotase [Bacteroidetes bacterium 24-39-8]OZA69426.1 MAG: dihydroorotase [Sphingobacteriia bacterium 39-39-8]HQR93225.1 dihydroorotase [Sediminibacterium sp.]HQS56359.1 dihydroorotase [Sediminibacterium sp.]
MQILLRQATIIDSSSPLNGQTKDILITDGIITSIEDQIDNQQATVVNQPDLLVCAGWVDPFSHFCDPGIEYKETLESGANAAAAGGYTRVFSMPNTDPVVDNKSQVSYVVQQSAQLPVSIHPIGAITKKLEGKDLAEMYDMKHSGAVAFSDGLLPVQTAGLFLKALQYVKAFDGVLIQIPIDKSIGAGGLINEGIISTQLGLPGIPAISEETIIKRDIDLARYTDSKLHITGVSTKTSIDLIAQAKKEGLQISCSVTPYHLYFSDEDLVSYDTNLKLNPPLRTVKDRDALREAVLSGVVDCIASHHLPQNWDNKVCEFEYAKSGMIGLQTAFAVVNTVLPELSNQKIIELFGGNARNIFDLPTTHVAVGSPAELTLFSRKAETLLSSGNNHSKSANSPFLEKTLTGKAVGIVHKGKLFTN